MEKTDATVNNLEQLLHTIAGDSACIVYTHAGPGSGSENSIFEGENTATMKVNLTPACRLTQEALITRFVEATDNIEGLELTFKQEENSLSSLLGTEGAPIVVEVKGEELDEIAEITNEVKEKMLGVDGLYNVVSSIEDGAPERTVSVNRTLAGIHNISVSTVIDQIKQQLGGK